ncbi:MAG: serine/threonine protein kinase [Bdellovibrionales bacterium]|nr:serine/threonine protein kinase [Bdellovibrionales bacterium]
MSGDHFLNLQPGTVVNGRYEVVKCLGTGSMGMVYACRHRELSGHLVAMKVLFAEVARDAVAAQRFRNEIVASYGVSHPNVVRAYEYFRDGDLIAFTMEYIDGGDLADRIGTDDPITVPEIVRMLTQMCSGVQAIHDAGIVHRDLKPENILLTQSGDIKITDFGIARCGQGPRLTEHNGVVGTIDYVSPEYLEQGQVDTRSDIYALGVLAYELITGEAPFKGKSMIETMTMRLRTDPAPPSTLRPDCPEGLDRIVLRAMTRDPGQRYQRAAEMEGDLQQLAEALENGEAVASPASKPSQSKAAPASTTPIAAALSGGSVVESHPAATQVFDSHSVETMRSKIQEGGAPQAPQSRSSLEYFESRPTRMESVLRQDRFDSGFQMPTTDGSSTLIPTVEVGRGSLSADRMQQLSLEMFQDDDESLAATILKWMLIIVVGTGLSVLVVRHYQPALFGLEERGPLPSYSSPR